jgi:transcriptional regulator of acetoin/glycerol metabolism
VLRFHQRPEFIGMISEGMVAFDGAGRILAANQSALNQLDLGDHRPLLKQTIDAIFDIRLDTMMARSSRQPSAVWPARDHAGRSYFAMLVGPEHRLTISAETRATTTKSSAAATSELSLATLRGDDPVMAYNVRCAERLMNKDVSILLSGETGTGKEAFARAIHQASMRAGKPFLAVNCAAIPENLIESELFGYSDGAFTGARRGGMRGKIVQADGGTLFLDEIGDMALALQSRLLRVLEEKIITPLGSDKPVNVDLRVISASHRDLEQRVAQQEFREDLYYRLNGITLTIPPLRERRDRADLIRCVLAAESEGEPIDIEDDAFAALDGYDWPGNIRQLRNVLRTAVALSENGIIRLPDLPATITRTPLPCAGEPARSCIDPRLNTLAAAERDALLLELERNDWNISATSSQLGMSRNTLYRKMKKHDIPMRPEN